MTATDRVAVLEAELHEMRRRLAALESTAPGPPVETRTTRRDLLRRADAAGRG